MVKNNSICLMVTLICLLRSWGNQKASASVQSNVHWHDLVWNESPKAWQLVKERYDYTPGFAKHVKRMPAQMNLSSLPTGYGFQYELKITDTTENRSKPIIDEVSVAFK